MATLVSKQPKKNPKWIGMKDQKAAIEKRFGRKFSLATLDAPVQHVAHGEHVEWLVEIIGGPVAHRGPRGFDGLVTREHHAFNVRVDFLQFAQHVDAAEIGHLDVENCRVHGVLARVFDTLAAAGGDDAMIAIFEDNPQRFAGAGLVIHDEQRWPTDRLGLQGFCC